MRLRNHKEIVCEGIKVMSERSGIKRKERSPVPQEDSERNVRFHKDDKLVDRSDEKNIVPLETIKRDPKPSKGISDNEIKLPKT